MDDSMIESGQALIARGYAIFPVYPESTAEPGTPEYDSAKRPARGVLWRRESTREPAQIERWAAAFPGYRWAIDCGKSGVVVVDLDEGPKHGRQREGREAWAALGEIEPETAVPTPGGGRHLFYAEPSGAVVGVNNTGAVARDVDLRGLGGYVIAYGLPAPVVELGPLPAVVIERMRGQHHPTMIGSEPTQPAENVSLANDPRGFSAGDPFSGPARGFTREEAGRYVSAGLDRLRAAQPGERNHVLNGTAMLCGHFVPAFWPEETVTDRLAAIAEAIGLGPAEAQKTIASGMRAGMREPYEPREKSDAPSDAQADGASELDAADALLAEMIDTDGLDDIGDLKPLVKGWLSLDTVTRILGKSTHGKSFIALDLAGHVGTGAAWRKCEVTQGRVAYIVAEGAKGIRKRVRAWEKWNGQRMANVKFLPRPVQMGNAEAWAILIEAMRRYAPSLVVIDTQARSTVGVDENSNSEMTEIIERAERLRSATGACVALVHHLGHAGEEGRGATAVKGALQTELLVRRGDDGVISLTNPKQKDDDDSGEMRFVLHVLQVGADEAGDPVTSCVPIEPGSVPVVHDEFVDPFKDSKTDAISRLIWLFQNVWDEGTGATQAQVCGLARERGMKKATAYKAWGAMEERGMLIRTAGTQRYQYIPVAERMSESQDQSTAQNGHDLETEKSTLRPAVSRQSRPVD